MVEPQLKISSFRNHIVPLFFIAVSITIVYSNALKGNFLFDDYQILERPNLRISRLDFQSITNALYFTPEKKKIYRPIPCLTLALNYYFGKDNPTGYHVVNIFIHGLTAIAVYVFFHILLSVPGIQPGIAARYRHELATIAAFFFTLHPLQTNVATYIIQRMTSIAALFYLLSITGYLVFRINTLSGIEKSAVRRYGGLAVFILSGACALLSKENTAILPVMILVTDYFLFYPNELPGKKKILGRIYIYSLLIFLALFIVFGLTYLLKFMDSYNPLLLDHRRFTLVERLLTESRVVFFYIYMLVAPNIGLLTLNHDVLISKNIITPPQTLAALIGLAAIIVIVYLFRKRYNLIAFAISWFFINLLIESTVIPLEIIYEHRTYLPGVMMFFLIALGIVYTGRVILQRKQFILLSAFVLILYGHGSYLRNVAFSNTISMWMDVVDKSPNLARAYANLGKAYHDHGFPEKASEMYQKALELDTDQVEALVNLATYNTVVLNKPEVALDLAKRAMLPKPKRAIGAEKLADVYMRLEDYKRAEHFYTLAVRRRNFFSNAINGLGVAKLRLGKTDEAIQVLEYGLKVDPSFGLFYRNLALLYADKKRFDDSIRLMNLYIKKTNGEKQAVALLAHIRQLSSQSDKSENKK